MQVYYVYYDWKNFWKNKKYFLNMYKLIYKFHATTIPKEFRIIRATSKTYRLISDLYKNNIINSTVNETEQHSRKYEGYMNHYMNPSNSILVTKNE